jgi:drug/metabolite transporter (DMT)-like permease
LAVSATRLSIAALVLGIVALARRRSGGTPLGARRNAILAVAGLVLAAHFATWIWSLEYTSVAVSTLLVATTPIWTALYDAIVLKRPLTWPAAAAFAAGGIGLWLVVGFNAVAPPVPDHAALGAALALGGSLAIAAYFVLVREVRASLDTRAIVTRTYGWAAIALVAAALVTRQPPPPLHDAAAWGGILAMALISQLLGHTALNASLRWFSPSAVSFSTLVEPAIAAVLALVIFGERLAPAAIAGGIVLLLAIGVVLREEPSPEVAEEIL